MKVWTLALIALLACSCSKAPDEPRGQATTVSQPSQSELDVVNWLRAVRQAHAAASASSLDTKQIVLDELRVLADVPSTLSADDASAMRREILGSAARLALELGRATDAWLLVEEGLALPGSDPFRTQLLLLDVEAQRALGNASGEAAALRRARADLGLH